MTSPDAPGTCALHGTTLIEGRLSRLRHVGPNWYATVMGTAITATSGAALPTRPVWLRHLCEGMWALSALMLVALLLARAGHWMLHPDRAVDHLLDPAVAPFYGCLPMALLAVGAAGSAVGGEVIGVEAAIDTGWFLWTTGTVFGLITAVGVPYLMIVRHKVPVGSAAPSWLLPIVPPMVSAATGPALAAHLPAGQARETMLYSCLALFGLSLMATLAILPTVVTRLVHGGPLPLALTPTLFFVLGPLGQSVTATGKIADAASSSLPIPMAHAVTYFSVLYGVPLMGFTLLWLALSIAMVLRALRGGMRFTMTWWGFTFPLGTCVTGAATLTAHTGLTAAGWLTVGLYFLLVVGWMSAWIGTVRHLLNGALPGPELQHDDVPALGTGAVAGRNVRDLQASQIV
ncbi:TDT family transporter [Streptomyces sp. OP7]|uniref:TDT family transporter n=1 Tax=Streptomyces sp. OP7 TaxID=3142462 RepID=UPI0032E8CE9F